MSPRSWNVFHHQDKILVAFSDFFWRVVISKLYAYLHWIYLFNFCFVCRRFEIYIVYIHTYLYIFIQWVLLWIKFNHWYLIILIEYQNKILSIMWCISFIKHPVAFYHFFSISSNNYKEIWQDLAMFGSGGQS